MLELLVVLLIAGVLSALAVPEFGRYMDRREAINARDAFTFAAARARAASIESGETVVLVVRPGVDSVLVMSGDGQDTLEVLDYLAGDMRANVLAEGAIIVCYTPRGFAHPGCGSGPSLPLLVGFDTGRFRFWSRINAVGQVERP